MVSMGILNCSRLLGNILKILFFGLALGSFVAENAVAFEWRIRPSFSINEMFSDNLTLSDSAKINGFVTEVDPGLSINGMSPWSNLNLNYRMQGLYNAGGREDIDINHQLQMSSLYQIVRNSLFLESSSSISQQNPINSFIATDNLSGNGERIQSKNYSISPYWTPHFGQYASGLVKVIYQQSNFDTTNNTLNQPVLTNLISDSDTFTKQAGLSSGSKFNSVKWNLNYSSQDQNSVGGNNVKFEQYKGDARYYFNRKYNLFAQAGYENNDYQTLTDSINNGFFYTFGGQWMPSQYYSLEAGYGNNKHVTVSINPSPSFTTTITYQNKDVGLNTGNTWNAKLNYRVKQLGINFNYSQDTTTVQQALTQQINALTAPGVSEINQGYILNLPNSVDDVIISKQANLSLNFQSGKSSYNASVYNTRRSYQLSVNQDNVYGASAGWKWQFEPRLSFYLQPLWQSTESNGVLSSSNQRYDVAFGLTRGVPINLGRPLLMNTSLDFRHIKQSSDITTNDYTENRATANFAVRF